MIVVIRIAWIIFIQSKTIRIDSIDEPIEIYTFDHAPERINQRGPQLKSGDWTKRNQ